MKNLTTSLAKLPGDLLHLLHHLKTTSISAADIKRWTAKDPVLSRVLAYVMHCWAAQDRSQDPEPYRVREKELSTLDGCLLWGARVIVPQKRRRLVLEELHESHTGSSKMKSLDRTYVWWPKMDADIVEIAKSCSVCQEHQHSPASAPLHPWEWPETPWSRLHLDFAGPFLGHMYLITVDAHSKWLDVQVISSITTAKTIEKLRMLFANHGLPNKRVTDNGPSFTSEEFKIFMEKNGIKHVTSAPYHPSSNGLAEREVQRVKQGLHQVEGFTIEEKLAKFLFKYRITPHSTTGVSPSKLLIGRCLKCHLDNLFPNILHRLEEKQSKQKEGHDSKKVPRSFVVEDLVYVEDFTPSKHKWIPGTIAKVTGPVSYVVTLMDGREVSRHIDNVIARSSDSSSTEPEVQSSGIGLELQPIIEPSELSGSESQLPSADQEVPLQAQMSSQEVEPPTIQLCRSSRNIVPPDRYHPTFSLI